MHISLAAEGQCDIELGKRLILSAGHQLANDFNCRGKGNLDKKIGGFARAARHSPWLIIRDLDRDAECPPDLVRALLQEDLPERLCFRIAVRSMESWLLADWQNFADWLQLSPDLIPRQPELLEHPKRFVADLARRSRSREVRERLAPDPESGAQVGPEYEAAVAEYIRGHWNPERASACERSESLRRTLQALARLPG